ncbi:hypothetical protein NDN08_003704 [Rhodosorus marinus]|uniref:Anaphase-promoting complex subunit 1 n=1 Tax=Rhodosorus marinus TaxID=101924 RepID=A0AAV8V1C8_9RHOD|nr:hypothetical protein NDN08_003704 [Rhodosorus marinus]
MAVHLVVFGGVEEANRVKYLPTPLCTPSWISQREEQLTVRFANVGSKSVVWRRSVNGKRVALTSPKFLPKESLEDDTIYREEEDLRSCATLARFWEEETSSLVVVGLKFAAVLFSSGEEFECPLPLTDDSAWTFSRVFSLPFGVIFQIGHMRPSNNEAQFFLMTHPLAEMIRIPELATDDQIIFSSTDLFLLVTYSPKTDEVRIWSIDQDFDVSQKLSSFEPNAGHCSVVKQLYKSSAGSGRPPKDVFLAHDMDGKLMVCLVVNNQLVSYSATVRVDDKDGQPGSVDKIEEKFRLDGVTSAQGICARQEGQIDLIVLNCNGELELRTGKLMLARLQAPKCTGLEECIGLADGISSRVSLVDLKGRSIRMSVENLCIYDTLTSSCIAICQDLLAGDELALLMRKLYTYSYGKLDDNDSPLESEWTAFCRSVLDFLPSFNFTSDLRLPSDWEWLSERCAFDPEEDVPMLDLLEQHKPSQDGINMETVLEALHIVYEEKRLSVLTTMPLARLASLNTVIAYALDRPKFVQYYVSSHGNTTISKLFAGQTQETAMMEEDHEVPDIFLWLTRCIESRAANGAFSSKRELGLPPTSKEPLQRRASSACLIKQIMVAFEELSSVKSDDGYQRTIHVLNNVGLRKADIDALQFGLRLVLYDVLLDCKAWPKHSWPSTVYTLVGRDDVVSALNRNHSQKSDWKSVVRLNYEALKSADSSIAKKRVDTGHPPGLSGEPDGCEIEDPALQLRFGADRRIEEVRRLLRSSRPVPTVAPEGSEWDPTNPQQHEIFFKKFLRSLAAGVGRGALVLRTYSPSDPTEKLNIPPLCLEGRLRNRNGAIVKLDRTALENGELDWPEFHNGAAAGFRVIKGDGDILTRTWIVYNKPSEESGSSSYAGVLLALGVSGHLPSLRVTDWYQHLLARHDLTSLALMIGIGACNKRSMHPAASKLLCLHVRHFNDVGFSQSDWNVSLPVQAAACVGLGLLYLGSTHRSIAEGMIRELTRRPSPSQDPTGREGLALAAGLSLGMVCLGSGGMSRTLSDLRVEDRLSKFIVGGKLDNAPLDVVLESQGEVETEPQLVREATAVDIGVSAPGAIMAVGLIYLRTNDASALRWLPIPASRFEVQLVRPYHILLRVFARSLIMWDSVAATEEWIAEQLPTLRPQDGNRSDMFHYLFKNNASDASSSTGAQKEAEDAPHSQNSASNVLTEVRAMAVCGASLAIGIRFAGTADSNAFDLLLRITRTFSKSPDASLQVCTDTLGIALSLTMCGTGNLTCLRELRRLQTRSRAKNYGSQMAVTMAIGLLFLGGGSQSFDHSNETIAALVCAVYPRFPTQPADNRHHLQALRHLYALAAKPRLLEAREVDTGAPCYVPVNLKLRGRASPLKAVTPCLLSQAELIESVSVNSPRYWSLDLPIAGDLNQRRILHVKRKAAYMPYDDDPKGVKGILARSEGKLSSSVVGFSVDPVAVEFTRQFCESGARATFYESILRDCLARDKPDLVSFFLELQQLNVSRDRTRRLLEELNLRLTRAHLVSRGGSSQSLHAPFHARVSLRSNFAQLFGSPLPQRGAKYEPWQILERLDAFTIAKRSRTAANIK